VEFSSGLTLAGGARFAEPARNPDAFFSLAGRADVLFGRVAQRMWAAGPYLSLRTDNFADFAPSAGLSLLIPVIEVAPIVVSAGAVTRWDAQGVFSAGALERFWWGIRSYNFQGPYGYAVGAFVEVREFGDPAHTLDFIAGIDVDLEFLAIPFIGLTSVIVHHH
jgi:hypothetical protein